MIQITTQDAVELPLHDAKILAIEFSQPDDGFNEISIRLKIHPDEVACLLKRFPAMTEEFTLVFKNCLQINLSVICYCTGTETVDCLDVIMDSEIIRGLVSFLSSNSSVAHLRIKGSHGSCWDIVTNDVFVLSG